MTRKGYEPTLGATMEIRPATESDAALLTSIALRAKAHWGYPAQALEAWRESLAISPADIASKPTGVAAVDGQAVGFYSLQPSSGSWELDNLWVLPELMHRGIGRALLAHALGMAASRGASAVLVDSDPNAEAFYLRNGARRVGHVPAPIAGQPDRARPQLVFEPLPGGLHLELQEPHAGLAESYRALVREFEERGEKLVPFTLSFPNEPFAEYLRKLEACARGEEIPEGFVPHSTFWLVRDGIEVVGVSNLRHRMTDTLRVDGGNIGYGVRPSARGRGLAKVLLRETVERARRMGVPQAWVTCAKNNRASVRTILGCGGVFVSEEFIESRGEVVQRYRIDPGRPA